MDQSERLHFRVSEEDVNCLGRLSTLMQAASDSEAARRSILAMRSCDRISQKGLGLYADLNRTKNLIPDFYSPAKRGYAEYKEGELFIRFTHDVSSYIKDLADQSQNSISTVLSRAINFRENLAQHFTRQAHAYLFKGDELIGLATHAEHGVPGQIKRASDYKLVMVD